MTVLMWLTSSMKRARALDGQRVHRAAHLSHVVRVQRMRRIYSSLVILVLGMSSQAHGACENVPQLVSDYLRSEPGWSLVDTKDLVEDDRLLWDEYHRGLC